MFFLPARISRAKNIFVSSASLLLPLQMQAPCPLPRDAVTRLTPPALQAPFFLAGFLGQGRLATETGQDRFACCSEIIQDLQLLEREPFRHQHNAQRGQENDQHWKANCRKGMRDGHTSSDTENLHASIENDLAPPYKQQWIISLDEALLSLQVYQLLQYSIRLDRTPLCEHG